MICSWCDREATLVFLAEADEGRPAEIACAEHAEWVACDETIVPLETYVARLLGVTKTHDLETPSIAPAEIRLGHHNRSH